METRSTVYLEPFEPGALSAAVNAGLLPRIFWWTREPFWVDTLNPEYFDRVGFSIRWSIEDE